jgi:hypothetical protein
MIPSTTNKLLVTEDWKKIYQSYRNADFKSYDFETLRRTMISYLRENYPEQFNDYVESSEYIALIDLIAYLGQNLSFRIDLNARENFLETAARRDSLIKLAKLISYDVSRNNPASGFLKIVGISTSDNVFDQNGLNLANSSIRWNDPTNLEWYQQFISIVNSSMPSGVVFGKPFNSGVIDGINSQQYRFNSANTDIPVYSFTVLVNGISTVFEVVSSNFSNIFYEEAPRPRTPLGFIYRNDNRGNGSPNTGFFLHFKQGSLSTTDLAIDTPVPNEIIGLDADNINNDDIWLWQLSQDGNYDTLWKRVSSLTGNNIIYNSLSLDERNIYAVTSRESDQIDLNFSDGSFGNLPKGQFKLWYRQSNGLSYSVSPQNISSIRLDIPYFNKVGQIHQLTLILALQYTVTNASASETDENIRLKAPQVYYTQNRMITGEDYNIAPLSAGSDILKIKSINRISSGISKYFELSDVSGKYSKTNIVAGDGILYRNVRTDQFEFEINIRNDVVSMIKNQLAPIIKSNEFKSFYLDFYPKIPLLNYVLTWTQKSKTTNQTIGYFRSGDTIIDLSSFPGNNLNYIKSGSLIKFVPPSGNYFLPNGKLTSIPDSTTTLYKWSQIVQVVQGSNIDPGYVVISGNIPNLAIPSEIIPYFVSVLPTAIENEILNLCISKRNFGLSLNVESRDWQLISSSNLDLISDFSLVYQNDVSNLGKDSSWMVSFEWTGKHYKVKYRLSDYIFESEKETAFFVDNTNVNYDYTTDTIVKDQITVLSVNPLASNSQSLGTDFRWQIDSAVIESDGYIQPKKVKVSFFDSNNDGQIDDPDSFVRIVDPESINPQTGYRDKFVFFQSMDNGTKYKLVDSTNIYSFPTEEALLTSPSFLSTTSLYYFYDPSINVIKRYSTDDGFVLEPSYFAVVGRSNLKFQYLHNSGQDRRLDPAKTNIIDIYLLTGAYDRAYRNWLLSLSDSEPLLPTSQNLSDNFSTSLEQIKSISDEIVFHPIRYKILFGPKAESPLQATFKATRNLAQFTSDNDIKTRILNSINNFFSLENWEIGQSFYFSELATYVMNELTPAITNFVIVPKLNGSFGDLYEVRCEGNEIFINGATINDIQIIDSITASEIKLN